MKLRSLIVTFLCLITSNVIAEEGYQEALSSKAGELKQQTNEAIANIQDRISEEMDDKESYTDKIKDTASDIYEDVTEAAAEATDYIADKVEDAKDYISDKAEDAGEYISDKAEAIKDYIQDDENEAKAVQEKALEVKEHASEQVDTTKDDIEAHTNITYDKDTQEESTSFMGKVKSFFGFE